MDTDPAIQKLTLDCLLNWKDGYLLSYVEHLENLVSYATLREEIVTWSIGRESHQVQDEHREGLIAVVLRILYPKILKRSAKFAGKVSLGFFWHFFQICNGHLLILWRVRGCSLMRFFY